MSASPDFAAALQAAVLRRIGAPGNIAELKRLTGGATKVTWSFRARVAEQDLSLILQLSTPRALAPEGVLAELPRVIGKEDAAMMIAAAASGVPTPPVRAVLADEDGLGPGYIMDRVPGETIARRILRDSEFAPLRQGFAEQCGAILARLHRMPAAALPFLEPFGPAEQVRLYRRVYQSLDHPQPVIELGLRWAEDHLPPAHRHGVVHGDFRLGNLICGHQRIAAVIDWEIGVLGDPVQDLGWLCVKTWRFGGEPAHLRFWEGFGSIKWAIMCLIKGQEHLRTGKRTVEQLAIGRRMEEPLHDFLLLLSGED
jgi:aminoglycoside phosphotransferase (APT) family kinase protein